ncbi:katanin p80 WD40 repeat-containing subunit B1-like isoform X1 [Temnothorax americanus]|uniref:katanin p80 WD40 repeat-containing subunit B1-like isoform X1 n=1 Tax=Temnothorax americanus TaxID=1964332 RepID=UPI004067F3AB
MDARVSMPSFIQLFTKILWHNKDLKAAVESAVAMNDLAVIVDLLGIFTLKPAMWNLDLCNFLLGFISDLFQSKYEMYITVACAALRIILRNFAPVIKVMIASVFTFITRNKKLDLRDVSRWKFVSTVRSERIFIQSE